MKIEDIVEGKQYVFDGENVMIGTGWTDWDTCETNNIVKGDVVTVNKVVTDLTTADGQNWESTVIIEKLVSNIEHGDGCFTEVGFHSLCSASILIEIK